MRMLAVAMRTAAWVTAPPGDQRNHRTREFSRRPPSVLADRRPRSVPVRLEEPGGHSEVLWLRPGSVLLHPVLFR